MYVEGFGIYLNEFGKVVAIYDENNQLVYEDNEYKKIEEEFK